MITNKDIDKGNPFDWGKASAEYAKFRDIYPPEYYAKILELGLCTKGQKVLDLGTGTGVLPRNLYEHGAYFTGADISENQIKFARELSKDASMDIEYIVSSVEELDFSDKTFDTVTAAQCFHYFDQKVAFPKICNLLKDDGHFCILFMEWLPFESEIAGKTEELVLKYNPDWSGKGEVRSEIKVPELSKGYFTVDNAVTFDVNVRFTRESWHGRIKACRGIGASNLSEAEIAAWEVEHMEYMNTLPPEFEIIHFVRILNLKKVAQD